MKNSLKPRKMKSAARKSAKKRTSSTRGTKVLVCRTIVLVYFLALVIAVAGCAGAPKITPHILDTQLNELREYEVMDPEQMTIRYKRSHALPRSRDGYGNGFFCAPQSEVAAWRDWCLRHECTKKQVRP